MCRLNIIIAAHTIACVSWLDIPTNHSLQRKDCKQLDSMSGHFYIVFTRSKLDHKILFMTKLQNYYLIEVYMQHASSYIQSQMGKLKGGLLPCYEYSTTHATCARMRPNTKKEQTTNKPAMYLTEVKAVLLLALL